MCLKGEKSGTNGVNERSMEEGAAVGNGHESSESKLCTSGLSVHFLQKLSAEVLGTYFLMFAGCASVVANIIKGSVTFPGICIVWGLIAMVMVYSVGHISGAHFNPAVTLAFATCRSFPWKQVSDNRE